jgi:hypothetical protein
MAVSLFSGALLGLAVATAATIVALEIWGVVDWFAVFVTAK